MGEILSVLFTNNRVICNNRAAKGKLTIARLVSMAELPNYHFNSMK